VNARIYLYLDESVVGPLSYEELAQYAQEGRIDENTQACWEGSEEWGVLSQMVKMVREDSPEDEKTKTKSFAKLIGSGVKVAGSKLANLAGEKIRDLAEKREQAKLAKQTIQSFPKELQEALSDGIFTEAEEQDLRKKVELANLDWGQMVRSCHGEARSFVSHVLADAVSDGDITKDEEIALLRYVSVFKLEEMSEMISLTVNRVRTLRDLRNNKLPNPIADRSVHWLASSEAIYAATQGARASLKPGTPPPIGKFYVTSERISFISEIKPVEYRLSNVRDAGHSGANSLKIVTAKKGLDTFFVPDADITAEIINCLNRLNNRTASTPVADTLSERRRIPKEVRSAVWIRDSGLCVECGADDYLEFDHVIPVSKGGSNTEQNIQLLCRRCNNTKRDRI
jgi:hypothetical protein